MLTNGDEDNPCSGQTLWGDASDTHAAGVAWDWVQIRDGVVAMSDPLGLISNLRLLDANGDPLTEMQLAMQLHHLVHGLPWQTEVNRALGRADA